MDTQIGTRPQIGALEIHQAYILASLNWLQQTRSLEMNHVAIEKAKLLGFDHSSVITDEDFINLNVKYGLVSGPLSYYKGDIPEDERQSHTCNCCRQFIKPYGNVVAIVNNKLVSIWDSLVLDEPYATVARNLAQLVKSKPVCNVFVSKVVKLK